MAYSSEVRISSVSGPAPSIDVSLVLWELSTTIDNANRWHNHQTDQDRADISVSGGASTPFSFVRGPDFQANNGHDISLAAYHNLSSRPGPMFRSGRLAALPPGSPGNQAGLVDAILVKQSIFTMASINASIQTPFTLADGTVILTVVVSSAPPSRTLAFVATGLYGAANFTYTLSFTIDPSDDQFDLTKVLEVNAIGTGAVVFTAGPGGGVQALIDNLFAGLFLPKITDDLMKRVTALLNTTAVAEGAKAAALAGVPSGLPAGVVLGVLGVAVAPSGDLVIAPAIGCFGSIIDKFLAAVPPGSSTCFIATAACGVESAEVSTLRTFRDECLLVSAQGRKLIALYERLSPPLARLLGRNRCLRKLARRLIVSPAYKFAKRRLRRRGTNRS
jgi:hypothetical protein